MSIIRPPRRLAIRLTLVALLVGGSAAAVLAPSSAGALASGGSVTTSRSVERDYLDDGTQTVVDQRTVHLTVGQTTNLRSQELINVSWSGAHPTGGITSDPNSDLSQTEEYPFVLLECRGLDSTSVPAADQLNPNTCWTQYGDERYFQDLNSDYPAWRSDEYAAPADRAAIVDAEPTASQPTACRFLLGGIQRWLPFVQADGTTDWGGPDGNCGQAPEMVPDNSSSTLFPSNETFGTSAVGSGAGQASFQVFTAQDHQSLGCSATVPCALVAVPIEGISCDPSGSQSQGVDAPTGSDLTDATTNCETSGVFTPGEQLPPQRSGAVAVSGALWWSASNWRNRMVVPLSFAPSPVVCGTANHSAPVSVYGSEIMEQATTQWAPHFCLNSKLFNFTHVELPEPESRTALANEGIEASLGSNPTDTQYPMPVVNAPVGVTGFAIAFDIDGPDGNEITSLKLDARLLAKLLTESYSDGVGSSYPVTKNADGSTTTTLSTNPTDLYADPEFQALNPGASTSSSFYAPYQASTLLSLDGRSDVMSALTAYINADPEARAWLNGAPDPWGMRVNPNYQGIQLPVNSWPQLDPWEKAQTTDLQTVNQCLYDNPVPWLPLLASPQSRLSLIAQDMQFTLAQAQTQCTITTNPTTGLITEKLSAIGRQPAGHHFMIGLVSLGDANYDGLHLASLETQTVTPWQPSWGQFTDASNRLFVAPSNASLQATADLLTQDPTDKTWPIPYDTLRTAKAGAAAYPGTMVVYATIPTAGLPASDAKDYSEFLQFAAGAGQVPGVGVGQLPPGFLPMTAADGLDALVKYTDAAAITVADQSVKAVTSTAPSSTSSSRSPSSGTEAASTANAATTPPVSPAVSSPKATSAPVSPSKATSPAPSSSAPSSLNAKPAASYTRTYSSGFAGVVLPLLAVLALIALLGALGVRLRAGGKRS